MTDSPIPLDPLPYHRLSRLTHRTGRWWRPLLVLLVGLGLTVAATLIAVVVGVIGMAVDELGGPLPAPSEEWDDATNPMDYLLLLGTLAMFVPVVVLAFRWAGGRRGPMAGTLHSVAGHFRWRLLGRAALVVLPVYIVINIGGFFLLPPDDLAVPRGGASLAACYVVIVLLTPFQCAAEEYLFRALPQQMLGTWLKAPFWGIVLPVPLFMLGHGYDAWGQVDIALFALCTGLLVWKSGGVELSIVLHVSNNLPLFLVGPFSASSMAQGDTGGPTALALSVVPLVLVTAGMWWWVSRREGVGLWEPVRGTGRSGQQCWDASARPDGLPATQQTVGVDAR
jgi:membrane protease YdiL (CAAX protease family)